MKITVKRDNILPKQGIAIIDICMGYFSLYNSRYKQGIYSSFRISKAGSKVTKGDFTSALAPAVETKSW